MRGRGRSIPPPLTRRTGGAGCSSAPLRGVSRSQYHRPMNIETLVALPEDLRVTLDRRAPSPPERNELVAAALRAYFAWPRPGEDASDLIVINAHADELNAEAEDALSYQVPL